MRVVITRAENEARGMAKAVEGLGCEPLVAPMLDINYPETEIDLEGVQGVVVTSSNAVRALEKGTEIRDIPLYCVGPQSRKNAEAAGFINVSNSFGGVKNLPVFVRREADPTKGPIVYLHGGNLTGNPLQDLANMGFKVRGKKVYSAGPVDKLPDNVREAFEGSEIPEFVTLFSIRTYKLFRSAMQNEGLLPKLKDTTAVCISPAVADFAREIRWKKVISSEEMTGLSILDALKNAKEAVDAAS